MQCFHNCSKLRDFCVLFVHLRCLCLGGCSNANFSVVVTALILVLDVSLAYVIV